MDLETKSSDRHDILHDFLALPSRVYAGDPWYCPRFTKSEMAAYRSATMTDGAVAFTGYRNAEPMCRVMAWISPRLHDTAGNPYGILGKYEALDDEECAGRLLRDALRWCHSRGASTVIGPMNGDTWHSYRFNCGPDEFPPFLMEPYNPAYYPEQWRALGFRDFHHYISKYVDDLDGVVDSTRRFQRKAAEHGYRLRTLDPGNFNAELEILYSLSSRIFTENVLYTPVNFTSFQQLYAGSRAMIDPECCFFALAPDGTPVGFLFGFPDESLAVTAMQGKQNVLSKLAFLTLKGRSRVMNAKSLGVLPDHRGSGLAGSLIHHLYAVAQQRNYHRVNLCLMHSDNPSGLLDAGLGHILRTYVLFHLNLADYPEYRP